MKARTICSTVALLTVTFLSLDARADETPVIRQEAAERFDRALRLADAGDLSGGLAEFQRAYALVPSTVVLYNLGLTYAALHRPVDAVRALRDALAHPEPLSPSDVERARALLGEQTERIGQVEVASNVQKGVVEIDNVEVAKLPLAGPLDVSVGSHVVGVVSRGYAPARHEVVVASHQKVAAELELVAIEGLLAHIAVRCGAPAADVFVDGQRVGKTPLEATVTVIPGTHEVEVRRAGYASMTRTVSLQDGSLAELAMNLAIDPPALEREGGWVAIEPSESPALVSVDGDPLVQLTGPVHLPAGAHRLRLERGGFLPAERDADVPLGGTVRLAVRFDPTPDLLAQYTSAAQSRRTWSWVTIAAGAAVAGGGVALALIEHGQLSSAENTLNVVNADFVSGSGRACDLSGDRTTDQRAACAARVDSATSAVNDAKLLQTLGWVAAGVGGAIAVTGVVLLATGDDPHRYDPKPVRPLLARWNLVPEAGPGRWGLSVRAAF